MGGVKRIAVIADTHDRLPPTLLAPLSEADEIWHLGDVCQPALAQVLQQLGPPLHLVLGNNDDYPFWPLTLDLARAGQRFHLVHIPPRAAPTDCDVVLHGHTHVPRNDLIDGVHWLNPGCVCRPNRGAPSSYAWLTLSPRRPLCWEIVLVRD
jgi:putative phosphoesterase